jgi:hypothetical protein
MSETKAAFRRRLARLLVILHTGTTSEAGTTLSVVCLPLIDHYSEDDSMNGSSIYDVTGTEWRRVSSWLASSGTAAVNRAFTASQASGRAIEVYEQFTPDELDDALRMALDEAYPYVAEEIVDTSLTGIASQYEYTVPNTIRDLSRMRGGKVQYEIDTAVTTFPYADIDYWDVRPASGSQTLVLPNAGFYVGRTLRLTGWGAPTYPATDATLLPLPADNLTLLAFKAAQIAWRSGPGLSGRDEEFARAMSSHYEKLFEANKDLWGVKMVPSPMAPVGTFPYGELPLAYIHRDPS